MILKIQYYKHTCCFSFMILKKDEIMYYFILLQVDAKPPSKH